MSRLPRPRGRPADASLRAVVLAVAAVAALAALAGLPGRATVGARTTADEPQYLLSAISLAEDGDLDISDELVGQRWRAFHEADLPQQTRPLATGARISPHDPLLPLLLVPGVALAGWVGAKATLAALAGLLAGVLVWTAVRRLDVAPRVAAVVVGVLTAAVPLAPYGGQIYPELPAALAVAVALAVLLGPLTRAGVVTVTVACCLLPWLGIKYAPVTAVLACALLWCVVRGGRPRAVLGIVAALAAAGVVYLVVHRAVWTGWTVYASADHFVDTGELAVMGRTPDWWARTTRLLGLLVERSFGIAAWQPAWLALVPATAAAVRVGGLRGRLLPPVLAVGWLTASYVALTMAGWWMPGRQIVVVLPAGVLLCAWWAGRYRRAFVGVGALGVVGVLMWLVLAWEAATGRVTLVFDFYATADPLYRAWRWWLPDYLAPSAATWWRHGAWLVVVAALAVLGWRTAPAPCGPPRPPSRSTRRAVGTQDAAT